MSDAADLWTRSLSMLKLQMSRPTFDTWLRGSQVLDHDDGVLRVGVRHAYAVDWLQHRLSPVIDRTVTTIAGDPVHVEFCVLPSAPVEAPEPAPDEPLTQGPILEAVREERTSLHDDGQALTWTDFYIKLKVAFRKRALAQLKGAKLSVFLCLALHVDRDGIAHPGIESIMRETGYGRTTVCSALDELVELGLVAKSGKSKWDTDRYEVRGYAWFGQIPAPAVWEDR